MKQSNKQKIKESSLVEDWFRIGEEELCFERAGFEDSDAFYSQICFFMPAGAEKYLKGFLVFHKIKFPKIHDLTELVKLCAKIDKNFSKILDDASTLGQYYLIARYPIEYKEAGKKEAKEALMMAEKIKEMVFDSMCRK